MANTTYGDKLNAALARTEPSLLEATQVIAEYREQREAAAAHDAVNATVARIRDWMALERDTGKDLDGLLDAILRDAGEVKP